MLTRNPIISAVDRRSCLFRRPRTPTRRSWRWIGAAIGTFRLDDLEENIRLLLLEEALKAPIEARCCSKKFPIITNNNMNFCQPRKYVSLSLSGLLKLLLPCLAFLSVPKVFFFLANIGEIVCCGNWCLNKDFVWWGQFLGNGWISNRVLRNPTKGSNQQMVENLSTPGGISE